MRRSDIAFYVGYELQRLVETKRESQSPGDRQSDLAPAPHEFVGKLALPFKQGEEIASLYQSHCAVLDPADRAVRIAGGNRMLNGLSPQFVGGIPASGAFVQLR